jgi:hypothetical protein
MNAYVGILLSYLCIHVSIHNENPCIHCVSNLFSKYLMTFQDTKSLYIDSTVLQALLLRALLLESSNNIPSELSMEMLDINRPR